MFFCKRTTKKATRSPRSLPMQCLEDRTPKHGSLDLAPGGELVMVSELMGADIEAAQVLNRIAVTSRDSSGSVQTTSFGASKVRFIVCQRTNSADKFTNRTAIQDTIRGFGWNDKLYGNGGADAIYGAAGNDRLDGGTNADKLNGGAGRDELHSGLDSSRDRLQGDADFDKFYQIDDHDVIPKAQAVTLKVGALYVDETDDGLFSGSHDEVYFEVKVNVTSPNASKVRVGGTNGVDSLGEGDELKNVDGNITRTVTPTQSATLSDIQIIVFQDSAEGSPTIYSQYFDVTGGDARYVLELGHANQALVG